MTKCELLAGRVMEILSFLLVLTVRYKPIKNRKNMPESDTNLLEVSVPVHL